MKVLVVGGGGREHALAWKIARSPRVTQVFCAPGNAGIAADATCVPIPANDVKALLRFALDEGVGLTVVGPELPLTLGLVDRFTEAGPPARSSKARRSSRRSCCASSTSRPRSSAPSPTPTRPSAG
jgi:phosphoribosylamine--glycine ligase